MSDEIVEVDRSAIAAIREEDRYVIFFLQYLKDEVVHCCTLATHEELDNAWLDAHQILTEMANTCLAQIENYQTTKTEVIH